MGKIKRKHKVLVEFHVETYEDDEMVAMYNAERKAVLQIKKSAHHWAVIEIKTLSGAVYMPGHPGKLRSTEEAKRNARAQ